MDQINTLAIRSILEKHSASGSHVDDRLLREISKPGKMYLGLLPSKEEFLKLVWQSIDATRPLSPAGQPRTLRDCASRLAECEWQFQSLVDGGFTWFQKCVDIDEEFDYSKLGLIALTPLTPSEKDETPAGTYYIYDGVHKSIVLAKRILRGETEYEPVQVLLLEPRRS
jgi:hypothetical protein